MSGVGRIAWEINARLYSGRWHYMVRTNGSMLHSSFGGEGYASKQAAEAAAAKWFLTELRSVTKAVKAREAA